MLKVESLQQQQQQLSVSATNDDFSDDDDDDADDEMLAQAADILEKSYSESSDKLTETSRENREGARPKHYQDSASINTDTRTFTPQTGRHTDNMKSLGAYGFTGTGTGYSLHHKKGDLFSCPQTESLAHCVSKDLRMGKGIAVLFKQKFGGVTDLKAQAIRIGEVGYLKRDDRYVYYLVTKAKYSDKPTYPSLESSLRSMKHHCVKHGVKRLSMPRIGCGLDRLVWNNVENILQKVFGDTNITITIYSF